MNKEIKHFKSLLKQGSLRHMYIVLDDKFQSELLNIIKDYENQHNEIKRLNNIIDELEKELNKKIEAIKTIKDMLGEEAKIVNPHIEVLETEYKYFLDKLKELKEEGNKQWY